MRFGHYDHWCWAFDEPGEFQSAVRGFLADGLVQDQRVCYVTSGDTTRWAELLQDLDEHNGLGRQDATRLLQLSEMYPGQTVEPRRQMESLVAAVEDALAAGFMGLRLAADATPLVRTPEQRDAFARWEHLADQFMIDQPFTGLCGYNRAELGEETIAQLACLHPFSNVGEPPVFRLYASPFAAASLSGELDASSIDLFRLALRRVELHPINSELVIDASELTFIDHRSMLTLADYARRRDVTVVLLGDVPGAARVVDLLELDDVRVEEPP